MKRFLIVVSAVSTAMLLIIDSSFAEEAYRKYRFSLFISNQSTADGIRTNAVNTSVWTDPNPPDPNNPERRTINDPRDDSAAKNEASISDDLRYDLEFSYGLVKWKWGEVTIDSSVGYFKGDLGDLEVAAEFNIDPPPTLCNGELTNYHMFYEPIGTITEIPVQLGGTLRFRPRAQGGFFRGMSPYIGLGVGYIFADVDPTDSFLLFSKRVAGSYGHYLTPNGVGGATPSGPDHYFKPAEVKAPDSFEYHVRAGIEFPITKSFLFTFNAEWIEASEVIDITIDGVHEFGQAIPTGETTFKYPETGLPVVVTRGGFYDWGRRAPRPGDLEPPDCDYYPGAPDGRLDVGNYYVQGGTISYSGFVIGIGLRYQF